MAWLLLFVLLRAEARSGSRPDVERAGRTGYGVPQSIGCSSQRSPPRPHRESALTVPTADPEESREAPDQVPDIVVGTDLDRDLLDPDAVDAVARLQERGHDAFLVGGCVRDLLLGHRPKDFDLATSARPQQVKRVFPRNCRIIGRRFKLAHLHFDQNRKILEVATFRRDPNANNNGDGNGEAGDDEDLLITRDNEFGTEAEDARRRDFSINALFFDPVRDEIIDYTGGLADLAAGVIRTIGDPVTRFREDPVRILRAIKFASRLDLTIEAGTEQAMREVAEDLQRAAPPRMLEEILRLLRGGHAFQALRHLKDIGALAVIVPDLDEFLREADREARTRFWRTLEALDGAFRISTGSSRSAWPPANGVLLGALFAELVRNELDGAREDGEDPNPREVAEDCVEEFAAGFKLPRRDSSCLRRVLATQGTLRDAARDDRVSSKAFGRGGWFDESLNLFEWTTAAEGGRIEWIEAWGKVRDSVPRGEDEEEFGGKRRRRRGSRRDRSKPRSEERERPSDEGSDERRDGSSSKPKDSKKKGRKKKDLDKDKSRGSTKESKQTSKKKRGKSRDERAAAKVQTIEPESIDTSAFDVELDPRRAATFGALVEGQGKRKNPRAIGTGDDYRPPKLDEDDDKGSPPPPPSDVFGDW
ncbi:MAG: polynucleotide adenylyltransferase PcnB [Planctomycetota bacterium]